MEFLRSISSTTKTLFSSAKTLLSLGLFLAFFTVGGTLNAQDKARLTPPFLLKKDEQKKGNYLAQYLELLRLEKEYRADDDFSDRYLQSRGLTASFLGDVREANLLFDESSGRLKSVIKPLENSPLAALQPVDAVTFLLKAAETERVIMLNEAHHRPQTRVLPTRLLRGLYAKGYRYLALETFATDLNVEATTKRKYLLATDGTMTNEPSFGDLVRQALTIGYTLVPYEFSGEPRSGESGIDRANRRETEEAQNIKARVFDRDPNAKLLVIAGPGHVSEKTVETNGDEKPWVLMAIRFKELTGIDPFTVDQQTMISHSRPELGADVYQDAVQRGWVKDRAVVFTDASGKAWARPTFGISVDAQVFLPPVKYVNERPDWLARELERIPYKIPAKLRAGNGVRLVQAFVEGEAANAVPVDQVLIRPSQPVPVLMLPRRYKTFRLKIIDDSGKKTVIERIKI